MNNRKKIIRHLLAGRLLTNLGDSLLYMCAIWYFNEKFSSPVLLSVVFASISIVDAFSFVFGPLIDRTSPKINLFLSSGFQTIVICFLFLSSITVNSEFFSILLCLLNLLVYVGSTIIYPAGEKIIPYLAEEKEIVHVNSVFTTSEKVVNILFNAISTVIISFVQFEYAIVTILAVFAIATKVHKTVAENSFMTAFLYNKKENAKLFSSKDYFADLRSGISEIKNHPDILKLFLPLSVVNLFYGIATVGLPSVSNKYISSEAYGYGSILTASALGGVFGAYLISRFVGSIQHPRKYTIMFLLIAGVSWILIPVTLPIWFGWVYLLIFISNGAINMMNVMFISLIHSQINITVLGRASTLTESLVSIMIPLGNVIGGAIMDLYHPLVSQYLYGAALILCIIPYLLTNSRPKANRK